MYSDDFISHDLPPSVKKVMYVEKHDNFDSKEIDDFIKHARQEETTSYQSEGECFWVVYPGNARQAHASTEECLRRELKARHWNR